MSATWAEVAFSTPATDAPVSSSTPATKRKSAMMRAPTSENAVAVAVCSASPSSPPRACTASAVHGSAGVPPGPSPSVPAA